MNDANASERQEAVNSTVQVLANIKSFASAESDLSAALPTFAAFHKELIASGAAAPITIESLKAAVSDKVADFEKGRAILEQVKIPGTQINLFGGSGSYTIMTLSGEPLKYYSKAEDASGNKSKVSKLVENDAPWTLIKPITRMALINMGRGGDLGDNENNKLLSESIGKKQGDLHMGAILTEIPIGDDKTMTQVFIGSTAFEITEEALKKLLSSLQNPDSVDDYEGGLFTAAGWLDEGAVSIMAEDERARATGASDEERLSRAQKIAESYWNGIFETEKREGIFPPQRN